MTELQLAFASALENSGIDSQGIKALDVSGQQVGLVALDAADQVI